VKQVCFFNLALIDNNGIAHTSVEISSGFELNASRDCAVSYQEVQLQTMPLTSDNNAARVLDEDAQGWMKMYANLSDFAGESSIRLAFVMKSPSTFQGYIDNIEVFLSKGTDLISVDQPFSIYDTTPSGDRDFRITFNLPERQMIRYSLTDMAGRVLENQTLDNILNQTLTLEPDVSAGLYLLRITIGDKTYTSKVLAGY
jgi:hypothetical protein